MKPRFDMTAEIRKSKRTAAICSFLLVTKYTIYGVLPKEPGIIPRAASVLRRADVWYNGKKYHICGETGRVWPS